MVKENKSKIGLGLVIISFILITIGGIGTFSLFSGQQFALYGDTVWTPRYFSGECIPRPENLYVSEVPSHTDDGTFYSCTSKEAKKYVPLVSGIQCEYIASDYSSVTAYICKLENGDTKAPVSVSDSRCVKKTGFFDSDDATTSFFVNAGDYIYLDTDKVFGEAKLQVRYPSYGLRVRSGDLFISDTTLSCEINSLTTDYHTIDAKDRTEIIPGAPFNAVSGLEQVYSNQLVTLSDVNNGNPIYISRPGYYNKVNLADDNFRYVDTETEYASNKIECIPRTTGCSDEAKIVKLVDQSCDKFGGAITGYSPVTGDSTQLCKYSCTSGSLKLTSDCIEVQKSCPSDKPLWDSQTGLCSSIVPKQPESEQDFLPLYLLGFGVVTLGISTAVNRRKQK